MCKSDNWKGTHKETLGVCEEGTRTCDKDVGRGKWSKKDVRMGGRGKRGRGGSEEQGQAKLIQIYLHRYIP